MCLRTRNNEPLVAKEDIVCFKLLKNSKFLFFFNRYYTPFQEVRVKLNQKLNAHGEEEIDIISPYYRDIGGGFIHAFRGLLVAKREKEDRWIIVKAIIPKGIRYYEGINGDICAKSMYITSEKFK